MQRKLTNKQRQALLKIFCLVLAVGMFVGTLFAVPCIVGAMPRMSGTSTKGLLYGDIALAEDVPAFALGGGNFEISKKEEDDHKQESENSSNPETEEESAEVPEKIPTAGDLFVTASNLCWYEIGDEPSLNIINRTGYAVDLKDYLEREFPIKANISSEPLVLIIHTHGSESYLPSGQGFYSPDESFRSFEEGKTVVHIGELLAKRLGELGISAIHDKTMHDKKDYNTSYVASSKAIEEYLSEYPSIRFVIDVHRDSVFDSAGNNIKPLTTINGKDCAQLMLVVGTDEAGIAHPGWRQNLTFATYLQQKMNDGFPTLARPINLRTAEFNQSYTKGSVILEVGSCGNTVEEAENAIICFADAYASLLKEMLG